MSVFTGIGTPARAVAAVLLVAWSVHAQEMMPTQTQLNGISGVFTAIGKGGTLTPTFKPATGDLNFSFSTDEGGHLALGVITAAGVMQLTLVDVGEHRRVLSSARIDLNPDGSERTNLAATDAQLRELSDRFNGAAGVLETLIVTLDALGRVEYEFVTPAGQKVAAAINP